MKNMVSEFTDGDVKRKLDQLMKVTENVKINKALIQMKRQTQAQLLEEEERLDYGMIIGQQMAEQAREEIEKMLKQYVDKVDKNNYIDMQRRRAKKELQETLCKLEKEKVQEKYDRMKQEDLKALEEKRKKKQRFGEELMQIIDDKRQAKERRREEEKLADKKINSQRREDLKKKAQRAAPRAKQIDLWKKQDLVFTTQEANKKMQKDLKSKQEALRLQRALETMKRERITKQKNLAEKRAHSYAVWKTGLSAQVLYNNNLKKMKADQKKAEDERINKAIKDELIKMKNEEKMRYEKNLLYADFNKQQMMERQLLAKAKCREETREAKRFIEEAQESFMFLGGYKEKMLKDARASGLSDKYLTVFNRKASYLLKTENPCLNRFP